MRQRARLLSAVLLLLPLLGSGRASGRARLLWEDVYNPGRVGVAEIGGAASLGPKVFVVGGVAQEERSVQDWLVRAYRARTGELLWEDFDLSAHGAVDVVTGGGLVHVLGSTVENRTDRNWLVRTYRSTTGRLLWEESFDRADRTDTPVTLALEDGVLFVAGISRGGSRADFHVRALRARTGKLLWEDVFDGAGRNDYLHDMTAAAGRVYMVGESHNPDDGSGDLVVRALRSTDGELLWQETARPMRDSLALAVAATGKSVAVVGQGVDIEANQQLGLVRVYGAHTGQLLWSDTVGGEAGSSGALRDVAIAGNRVVVAGNGFPSQGASDYLVRAYRTRTGAVAWEDTLVEGDGLAAHLVVDGTRLYVAGNSDSGFGFGEDFLVRAYRVRNGGLLWEDQRDGNGSDLVGAIALAGPRVVVAGTTRRPAPVTYDEQGPFEQDVTVLAYRESGSSEQQ